VDKGDTLSAIAQKHDVTVAQLRDWNHLKNDNLRIGQVLHLSGQ
jgi:phosphate transport system substrate-binding protein